VRRCKAAHALDKLQRARETNQTNIRAVAALDPAPAAEFDDRFAGRGIEDVDGDTEPTEVVHRPHQVFGPGDLDLLVSLGRRAVVSQLDLIAYRNPGYFPDRGAWLRYQRVARDALAAADRVVCIPMSLEVDSINVATAAAIALHRLA